MSYPSDPYGARSAYDPPHELPDDVPDDLPYGSPAPFRPPWSPSGRDARPPVLDSPMFGGPAGEKANPRRAGRRRWLRRMSGWSVAALIGWTIAAARARHESATPVSGFHRFMDATAGPVVATFFALAVVAVIGFLVTGRVPGARPAPRGLARRSAVALTPLLVVAVVGAAVAVVADHVRHPDQVAASGDSGPRKVFAVPALAPLGVNPAQVSVAYGLPDADPALFTDVVGVAPARVWQATIYPFGPNDSGEAFIDVYRLAPGTTAARALAAVETWFNSKDTITNISAVRSSRNPAGWSVALEGTKQVRSLDFAAAEGGYLLWGSISPDLNTSDAALLASGRPLMKALTETGIEKFGELTSP
jgi:hypothetical protein